MQARRFDFEAACFFTALLQQRILAYFLIWFYEQRKCKVYLLELDRSLKVHFQLFCFHHLLHTVAADDVYCSRCSHGLTTAGAN